MNLFRLCGDVVRSAASAHSWRHPLKTSASKFPFTRWKVKRIFRHDASKPQIDRSNESSENEILIKSGYLTSKKRQRQAAKN